MLDWVEPDDAPILTAEIAARAEIREGGKLIRPATGTLTRMGRPALGDTAKKQVTLRIDSDIVAAFRAGGAGWQSRMNAALRGAMESMRSSAGESMRSSAGESMRSSAGESMRSSAGESMR